MKTTLKWLGMAALVACASLTLSSCGGGGDGSSDTTSTSVTTLPTLDYVTIESLGPDGDASTISLLTLRFTATSTGSDVETGLGYVRFSYGDPCKYYSTDMQVAYTYDIATGLITFAGATAATSDGSSTTSSLSFDSFSVVITTTSEVAADAEGYQSCAGYQSATSMLIDGNTVSVMAQPVEMTYVNSAM